MAKASKDPCLGVEVLFSYDMESFMLIYLKHKVGHAQYILKDTTEMRLKAVSISLVER